MRYTRLNENPEYVSVDGFGVTSDDLREHPRTQDMSNWDTYTAVKRAHEAGWLLNEPAFWAVEQIQRIRLNDAGIAKVVALTEPWWRAQVLALGRDMRTAMVSGVVSLVVSVVTVVVLS